MGEVAQGADAGDVVLQTEGVEGGDLDQTADVALASESLVVVGGGEGGFALAALAAGSSSLLDDLGVLGVVEDAESE